MLSGCHGPRTASSDRGLYREQRGSRGFVTTVRDARFRHERFRRARVPIRFRPVRTIEACPACLSERLAYYPVTRRAGKEDFRCRDCGMVGWAERDDRVLDPVGLEEVSVEDRSAWFALKRVQAVRARWDEVLGAVVERLGTADGRSLYDIGAGDGHFLSVARDRGFEVRGNELLAAAVEIARDEYDVELDLGDLTRLKPGRQYDAVTLWCVLAHVPHGDALLTACRELLTPGGVLYLQTPHRCAVDRAALGLVRGLDGRGSRWVDRRIAEHHWVLHTPASMTALLERLGFVDVEVQPKAMYSLKAAPYLQSLGLRNRPAQVVGRGVDRLLDRGLAPRITLDAYARRPVEEVPAPSVAAAARKDADDAQGAGLGVTT